MNRQNDTKTVGILFACGIPVVIWLALIFASCYRQGNKLFELLERLMIALENPMQIVINEYSVKAVLIFLFLYAMGIGVYFSSRENRRPGEEYGSAKWGSVRSIVKRYIDREDKSSNLIITQTTTGTPQANKIPTIFVSFCLFNLCHL